MTAKRPRVPSLVVTERLASLGTQSDMALVTLRTHLGILTNFHGAQIRKAEADIQAITSILRRRERPAFEVSDHAVMRYLERFEGVDMSPVRGRIQERVTQAAKRTPGVVCRAKGDAVAYTDGDVTFIVARNNCVVTCHDGTRAGEELPP